MTKPQNVLKYCPKCGSNEFNFDKDRAFLCNNCNFNFYINSSAAVAALIVNDKGELLLTKRAFAPGKGMLDLPGGFVDPLESAEKAIVREIKEELNLDIIDLQYLISSPNKYVFSEYTVYTTDMAFIVKVKNWDNIKAQDDVNSICFVNKENYNPDLIFAPSIKEIINTFFSLSKLV